MKRANYIGAPEAFRLNQACRIVVEAYGVNLYLVGSSLERRDFRDVDLRCILPDAEYDALFPGIGDCGWRDARWSLLCTAISQYLSSQSGLPVDFQFQRQTQANEMYDGQRCAFGTFVTPASAATGA